MGEEKAAQSDGNVVNLERLIDEYGGRLYRMCFLYLGERQMADGVV